MGCSRSGLPASTAWTRWMSNDLSINIVLVIKQMKDYKSIDQLSTFLKSSKTSEASLLSSCFAMKGCRSICRNSILSSPFFLIDFRMKSFATSPTSTYSGKVISSDT